MATYYLAKEAGGAADVPYDYQHDAAWNEYLDAAAMRDGSQKLYDANGNEVLLPAAGFEDGDELVLFNVPEGAVIGKFGAAVKVVGLTGTADVQDNFRGSFASIDFTTTDPQHGLLDNLYHEADQVKLVFTEASAIDWATYLYFDLERAYSVNVETFGT